MDFIQQVFKILSLNFVELLVFGLLMLAFQWLRPVYKEQKNWDKSSVVDISYSFILALCAPIFYIVPIAMTDKLISISPYLANIPTLLAKDWPIVVQLLLAVFLIDFVSYWRHRLMHMKWLWPIHAIHHSSTRLNWLSTERFHPLNFFVSTFINTLAVQLLLGPEVAFFASLLRRFYNFFIHANLKLDYGLLGFIFVSPRFHHFHHSSAAESINKNYCTFFACIDWVFGTFYLPQNKFYPQKIGVPDEIEENILKQWSYPFKVWRAWFRK